MSNKIANNRIPFGLKNGTLVQVSEVKSGLACGCVCPSCKKDLQANKGKVISHYFSHDPTAETNVCESAFETSIHLMAKQIFSEESYSVFPALAISLSKLDANENIHTEEASIEVETTKAFKKVELEKRLDEIRPDIITYVNGEPFLIEVAVTSFADNKKKKIIRELGLFAIEIDLSSVDYTTTKDELKKLIIDSSSNKQWLSNPKTINVKKELNAKLDENIRVINEGIYKNRSNVRKSVAQSFHQTPRSSQTKSQAGYNIAKQYDPRWFVCEACRHIFKVPLKYAPYSIETISCPECEYDVSAKQYMA